MINTLPPEQLTAGSLLDYLHKMEEEWTEQDTEYLGEFRNHRIFIPYFKKTKDSVHYIFTGYGEGRIFYDGGLDFIIEMKDVENNL